MTQEASQAVMEAGRIEEQDISWLPAWRIAELVAAREVSPVEVTEHFIGRIADLDPQLHAFRMTDIANARQQARDAEKAILSGDALGPLHGVPIALKEHIPVAGLHWHDLKTNQTSIPSRDGIEAERLRKAGAVLMGTTVAGLTAAEFGASDRQPLNAWDRGRICGDSSSGSACAVAGALVPAAIAVDGLGSTRLPAAYSGLVGLLPTKGRVPMITWNELSARLLGASGPLSRSVRDAALLFSVLAGPDARDFGALPDKAPDCLTGLDDGAHGMRLLWTDDFGFGASFATPDSHEIIETVRNAAARLTAAGAAIGQMAKAFDDPTTWCNVALVSDHAMFINIPQPDEVLVRTREVRGEIAQALSEQLRDADFILSPTAQQIAPTLEEWDRNWAMADNRQPTNYMPNYTVFTGFMNLIGWPAITVPAGLVCGMPVGMQIIGKPNSEPGMLRLAQAFSQLVSLGMPPSL